MDVLILRISKFVAKIQIIWELANFRSASRTGDYGTSETGETGGSASRTGDCGTGETSGGSMFFCVGGGY